MSCPRRSVPRSPRGEVGGKAVACIASTLGRLGAPWCRGSRGPGQLSSPSGLYFHTGGSWGTSELGRVTMRKCEGTVIGDPYCKTRKRKLCFAAA